MPLTITRSYEDYATAAAVVEELGNAGFSDSDISVTGAARITRTAMRGKVQASEQASAERPGFSQAWA